MESPQEEKFLLKKGVVARWRRMIVSGEGNVFVGLQNGTAADRYVRGRVHKNLFARAVKNSATREALVLLLFFHLVGTQNRCQLARWEEEVLLAQGEGKSS